MNGKMAVVICIAVLSLVIASIALFQSAVITSEYNRSASPNPTSGPQGIVTPYPQNTVTTMPTLPPNSPATIFTDLKATPSYDLPDYSPNSGEYLLINGTITNNTPNYVYNVRLKVTAREENVDGYAINMVIPIPISNGILEQYTGGVETPQVPMHGAIALGAGQFYTVELNITPLLYNGRNTIYDVNITALYDS